MDQSTKYTQPMVVHHRLHSMPWAELAASRVTPRWPPKPPVWLWEDASSWLGAVTPAAHFPRASPTAGGMPSTRPRCPARPQCRPAHSALSPCAAGRLLARGVAVGPLCPVAFPGCEGNSQWELAVGDPAPSPPPAGIWGDRPRAGVTGPTQAPRRGTSRTLGLPAPCKRYKPHTGGSGSTLGLQAPRRPHIWGFRPQAGAKAPRRPHTGVQAPHWGYRTHAGGSGPTLRVQASL